MKLIDLHCDTICKIYNSFEEVNLYENKFQVDLKKLKKANSLAQFFSLFIDTRKKLYKEKNYFQYFSNMLKRFYREIEENKDIIALARNYMEMKENTKKGKISAFLTIEEGGVVDNKLENLKKFYDLGVRLITLTWNYPNCIGYPNFKGKYINNGLTLFGYDVIKEMNRLGMIVDVSHLSDKGFYDVAEISNKPFIASHSNARFIENNPRNLTDDMIKIISKKGGVIGINFYADFLAKKSKSYVEDIIEHIKYIKKVGGIDVISLGSDFDGIDCELEINNIGEIDKLILALEKEGFKEYEIEKIAFKNIERVIKDVMK